MLNTEKSSQHETSPIKAIILQLVNSDVHIQYTLIHDSQY